MTAVEIIGTANPVFGLHTDSTSYVFAVTDSGLLRHLHWGGPTPAADVMPPLLWQLSTNDLIEDITQQEYPAHGRFRYAEQALRVRFPDGSRELDLKYSEHEAGERNLVVRLVDARGVIVDLHYEVLDGIDAIRRWATIGSEAPGVVLESVASAQFNLPFPELTLHNVAGRWGAEFTELVQQVRGKVVLESRRGVSNHHHNPYAVLSIDATETAGRVWGMALEFGGNTKTVLEQTQYGYTLAQLGINDFDSEIPLTEPFVTPAVVATFTHGGFDALSQTMHAYGDRLMSDEPRPVLYNSWEATEFAVSCDGQIALADRAAQIGAELFVVDDGWFGRRSPDEQGQTLDGLGDWWVDPHKFPDGLGPLVDHVRSLGMRFGIWVEPEMVNPKSDLFAEHADWIYREQDRQPDTARGQYVLNLTRPEVQEFITSMLDSLLDEHDISYIKWDANRPMSQVGASRDVWYQHTRALYDIVTEVKSRHPGVLFEACASGGGRVDFGTLAVFDDFWTSDNTDARDRLDIQQAYSLIYPPRAMRAWVTDVPNFLSQRSIPLAFRFHVAMMGSLGVGSDLTKVDDLSEIEGYVRQYQSLRPLMQRFHRLENPSANDYRLFQYDSPDGAVLFAYLPSSRVGHTGTIVRLRGLDPDARYRFTHDWQEREVSGAYLMNVGIRIWLQGDYASTIIRFDRVTESTE